MEFDWQEPSFETTDVSSKEIEESFEDPFALRLLPDGEYAEINNRFFCLGSSVSNRLLFSLFWTDGKKYRVLCVKGSGWDLGTIEPEGHPAVKLDPLIKLRYLNSRHGATVWLCKIG